MSAAVSGGSWGRYELRPWGRPIGVIIGSLVAALVFGPLDAFLQWGSGFLAGLGAFEILGASSDYFAENLISLMVQFTLIWWWLSFVKYRSRTAFALTGIALAAYPVTLIIGRNIAFGTIPGVDVLLITGAIVAAHALAGGLSMLALHFAAFRRTV